MDNATTDSAAQSGDENCPACGLEVPAGAPEGMCPACLLNADTIVSPPPPTNRSVAAKRKVSRSSATSPRPAPKSDAAASDPNFAVPLEKLRELFPDLEILGLLGAGGMGAVYRARQPRLDRTVALKVLTCPPEMHDDFSLRFEREAQVLARLNHPNIVTIFDFGEIDRSDDADSHGNLFYFIMEFVNGADLNQMIRTGELKPEQALRIVPQICDALQYAHDEGITHRDIKPANILVGKKGRVRIADFGLAKLVGADSDALGTGLTLTGTSMGTPHYMAPEQWEPAAVVDHRADIYSLGVVFYEMLTGERPHGIFDPPSRKIQVDVRLDEVVLKAMEKDIDLRYQQASEVKEDVTRVVAEPSLAPQQSDGRTVKVAVGLVMFAAMLGGGWWWWSTQPRGGPGNEPVIAEEKVETLTNLLELTSNSPPPPAISETLPPGRLRGDGTFFNGKPVDLSRVAEFADIIDVQGGSNSWIALRANGDTISSNGEGDAKNIRRLARMNSNENFVLINRAGKLEFPSAEVPPELPEAFNDAVIVDASDALDHGLALTDDGRAIPWGRRYRETVDDPTDPKGFGTPKWPYPPASALENVADVAVLVTHAAAIHHDGSLSVWGWEGLLDLALPPSLGEIRKIGNRTDRLFLENDRGSIWSLELPRNPSPNSPFTTVPRFIRLEKGSLGERLLWMDQQEKWRALRSFPGLENLLDRHQLRGPMTVWGKASSNWLGGDEEVSYLLWIEPNAAPTASPFPLARPTRPSTGGKVVAWHYHQWLEAEPFGLAVLPAGLEDVVAIDLGPGNGATEGVNGETQHALALQADGSVSAWGRDAAGETQVPAGLKPAVAISAGQINSAALHEDGTVTAWGNGKKISGFHETVVTWKEVVAIASGSAHIVALTSTGQVLVAGTDKDGNLDVPEEIQGRTTAVSVGNRLSLALLDDGTVRVWGITDSVDTDSLAAAREVAAIAALKELPFSLDRKGRLSAHFSKSEPSYPPERILALEGITRMACEKKVHPIFAAYAAADDRWHFWGEAPGWESEHIEEQLAEFGSFSGLEIALPGFLIGIQKSSPKDSVAATNSPLPRSPAYPTDEAEFREWLDGKVLAYAKEASDSAKRGVFWFADGQLHWSTGGEMLGGRQSASWFYSVPEKGTINWEWNGNGDTHTFRVNPEATEFDWIGLSGKAQSAALAVRADLSPPGPLVADGDYWNKALGKVDISAGKDFSDFVQIHLGSRQWVGLRPNGTLVRNGPISPVEIEAPFTRLCPGVLENCGAINHLGELDVFTTMADSELEKVPAEINEIGVVDAHFGDRHGIALLRDGTTRVWGDRYVRANDHPYPEFRNEKPWPRPPTENLENVESLAVSATYAAALSRSGLLSIWGEQGVIEIDEGLDQPIRQIASGAERGFAVIDAKGQLQRLLIRGDLRTTEPPSNLGPAVALANSSQGILFQKSDGRWMILPGNPDKDSEPVELNALTGFASTAVSATRNTNGDDNVIAYLAISSTAIQSKPVEATEPSKNSPRE